MKILYTNFHPRNGGGHVTYILNLVRSLANGHDVTVAVPGTSRLFRYAHTVPGVRVVDIRYPRRVPAMLQERHKLRVLLAQSAFDIVHVNGSSDHMLVMMASLGLRNRPRIVFTKHNDHPSNSLGNAIRARFATNRVIAVSEYVAAQLRQSPYRRCGIAMIRHGVDTEYFTPSSPSLRDALRGRYFGPDWRGKLLLGSSGGTDYDKGWLDLLAGIALLPIDDRVQIKVMIAGDLPGPDKIQRVKDLGLTSQVVFPGLLDDVRPALAACDVGFVLSYREALSFACREVMSLGLPALVSNAGGLPENVIDGMDGWVVPVRDPQAIAQKLRFMLDHRDRVASMGDAARDKAVREFGLRKFVLATLAVYQSLA